MLEHSNSDISDRRAIIFKLIEARNLAAFLVSDGAAALTGNVEYIDAGYHIVG